MGATVRLDEAENRLRKKWSEKQRTSSVCVIMRQTEGWQVNARHRFEGQHVMMMRYRRVDVLVVFNLIFCQN